MERRPDTSDSRAEGEALLDQGRIYYDDAEHELAEIAWSRAISLGSVEAMIELAQLKSAEMDYDAAKELLQSAVSAGSTSALCDLGSMLIDDGDVLRGTNLLLEAVEHGETAAMHRLAMGHEKDGEIEEAAEWWEIAIAHGDTDARYQLGLLRYKSGAPLTAVDHWCVAMEAGHERAAGAVRTLAAGCEWVDPFDHFSEQIRQGWGSIDWSGIRAVKPEVLDQNEDGWEYLFFADELEARFAELSGLRAETWTPARHRKTDSRPFSLASETLEFVHNRLHAFLTTIKNFRTVFDASQIALAFGNTGQEGIEQRITELAATAVSNYEQMLLQLASIRSAGSETAATNHLLNCLGEMIEAPLARCEEFLYETIAGLRAVAEHGSPLTISLNADLDDNACAKFDAAFDRAFGEGSSTAPVDQAGAAMDGAVAATSSAGMGQVPSPSGWVESLLLLSEVQDRLSRQRIRLEDASRMLEVLDRNGMGGLSFDLFASQTGLQPSRVQRYLAQLVQVVNIDGYEALSVSGATVKFNRELLERQLGIDRQREAGTTRA